MRHQLAIFLVFSSAIMGASGCTKESKLLGKWSSVDAETVISIECLSDHTAIVTQGGISASGTCSMLDDGRAKVDFTIFGTKGVLLGTFAEDDLVVDIDGKPTKLIKSTGG